MSVATLSPTEVTNKTIVEALARLPHEALPDLLQFIEFLEYKYYQIIEGASEDEALWEAVQASEAYRKQHPNEELERYSSGPEFLKAVADL